MRDGPGSFVGSADDVVWQVTADGGEVPPPLEEPVTVEVVVVGQGAAGLTAGALLAEAGVDVVVLDAGHPGAGASGRNGGFLLSGLAEAHHEVRRRLGRDRATALHRGTAEALDATAQAHPESVRRVGSLRVSRSPRRTPTSTGTGLFPLLNWRGRWRAS